MVAGPLSIRPCCVPRTSPMKSTRKKPTAAAKLRSWRVSIIRKRGQYLGTVEAPDEKAAEAAAVAEFDLNDEQRPRLVVSKRAGLGHSSEQKKAPGVPGLWPAMTYLPTQWLAAGSVPADTQRVKESPGRAGASVSRLKGERALSGGTRTYSRQTQRSAIPSRSPLFGPVQSPDLSRGKQAHWRARPPILQTQPRSNRGQSQTGGCCASEFSRAISSPAPCGSSSLLMGSGMPDPGFE